MSNLLKDLLKNQGLALESEEVVHGPVEEVPAEEAQEATDEVVADADAIGEAGADADKVEEAVASLESLCLAMESALKTTRGMSARELAMTQRAAAYVIAPLGVAVPAHAVSLESIDDAEALQAVEPPVAPVAEPVEGEELDPAIVARQERTEVALESFKEMAKNFAEVLKKMWAKIRDMLVGFWKKMNDWSGIQIKRVNSLKKKVGSAKAFKIKVPAEKLSGIVSLVGAGKPVTTASVVVSAASIDKATHVILNDYSEKLVTAFKETPDTLPKLEVAMTAVDGIKIVEKDGAYGIEPVKQSGGPASGDQLIDSADLPKICDSVLAALSAVQRYRGKWKETEGAADAAIRAVENAGKEGDTDEAKAAAKAKSESTRKTMRAAAALPPAWGKVVTKSTNAYISYVEKCLKLGGGKVDTEGKELATA